MGQVLAAQLAAVAAPAMGQVFVAQVAVAAEAH
jgi:hypothetical protein